MIATSTYSQDAARGHDHPVSCLLRQQRIDTAKDKRATINTEFEHALFAVRTHLQTGEQLARLLNVASAALLKGHGPSSYLHQFVGKLDELADEVTV